MAVCGSSGNYGDMGGGCDDCEDQIKVVATTKRVTVPCTRNVYKAYTVKVPRMVNETKARTVNYTDYENRCKTVPYTDYQTVNRVKYQNTSYQVPVQKNFTKMVTVTSKVPKTIYVDVTRRVPQSGCRTVMETRHKTVPIPYQVTVPVRKFKTVNVKEPVNKTKVVFDKCQKIVYDTQVKTRCEPKTTMVTKTIPVFNVVTKPPAPQPMPMPQPPMASTYNVTTGDFNNDGMQDALFMSQRGSAPLPMPLPEPTPLPMPMAGSGMMAASSGMMAGSSGMSGSSGMMAGGQGFVASGENGMIAAGRSGMMAGSSGMSGESGMMAGQRGFVAANESGMVAAGQSGMMAGSSGMSGSSGMMAGSSGMMAANESGMMAASQGGMMAGSSHMM